jgi:hypothetical protein
MKQADFLRLKDKLQYEVKVSIQKWLEYKNTDTCSDSHTQRSTLQRMETNIEHAELRLRRFLQEYN